MFVIPYYFIPIIPIVLAPIFILPSNLKPEQKLFYSFYPFGLYILVYLIFHNPSRKPRSITFEKKGWYTIIYNIQNEKKLKNWDGYREINFASEPVLLTSTKQMDIIPISDSKHYLKEQKNSKPKKIIVINDAGYKANEQDSSIYIYYFHDFGIPRFNSTYCFYEQNKNTRSETFFIGTTQEYFSRDSIYPIDERSGKLNNFFKDYCDL